MADFSRALLLPELEAPEDIMLKTLALYWDEIVVPSYTDRGFGDASAEPRSQAITELIAGGAIIEQRRAVDVSKVYATSTRGGEALMTLRLPHNTPPPLRKLIEVLPDVGHDDPPVVIELKDEPLQRFVIALDDRHVHGLFPLSLIYYLFTSVAADHYLRRATDALALAEANHCVPMAASVLGHIGSLVGEGEIGAPVAEGGLLSAAISAFEIDPDTPVAEILTFRERNRSTLGRFRASLADLAEQLQQGGPSQARLASARDTYRNRVEPALSSLESGLKESRMKFFLKSIVGASVVALGPVDPKAVVVGGARLSSQTISYAFSRKRLLDEHPFSYLHKVSTELGADAVSQPTNLLEPIQGDLANVIQDLLMREVDPRILFSQFIFREDFKTVSEEIDRRLANSG